MPPVQRLVTNLIVGPLGPGATQSLPHGIRRLSSPARPTSVMPDIGSPIACTAVDPVSAYFFNPTADPAPAATFCVRRDHSIQNPDTYPPQLWQGGFTGGSGGNADTRYGAENKDVVTIRAGQPVALHGSGVGVVLASAIGKLMLGMAISDTAVGFAVPVLATGALPLADWTFTVGTPLLIPGASYYLADVAGMLSATAPSVPGEILQFVGRAVSPNILEVQLAGGIVVLL